MPSPPDMKVSRHSSTEHQFGPRGNPLQPLALCSSRGAGSQQAETLLHHPGEWDQGQAAFQMIPALSGGVSKVFLSG